MKPLTPVAISCCVFGAALRPAAAQHGEAWTADFDAAKARAAADGRDLLVVFTGSDWCAPCMRMAEEVFAVDAFTELAAERYELVVIDDPRRAGAIDEATRRRNDDLRQRFAVNSWPTLFLVDAAGRPFARTKDYRPGGPERYLEHLRELQKNKVARDTALAQAHAAEGTERAELLDRALRACGEFVPTAPYQELIADLLAADPADPNGLAAGWRARIASDAMEVELPKLGQTGKWREFVATIDAFLRDHRPDPAVRQKTLYWHGVGLLRLGENRRAVASLEQAVAIGAEAEYGARSKDLLARSRK